MHQVVVDAINRVDLDLRKSLFSNIVLSGGSTLCRGKLARRVPWLTPNMDLTGFGDRLLNEVKKLALKDVKIKIYAPPERKYSTWIGGSILAGLNTFKKVSRTTLDSLFSHDMTILRRCGSQRKNIKRTRTSFIRSLAFRMQISLFFARRSSGGLFRCRIHHG